MRRRIFLAATILATGCTRDFYRNTADQQVYPIIGERVFSPSSEVGRIDVMPRPESRLADPFHPDRPPQPPDDPLAHPFMTHPYGLHGSKKWGKDGFTPTVELGDWTTCAGVGPDGVLALDRDKAFDIALTNSREYQTAVEQVYLTALSLTLNRFEFDCRYFLTNSSLFTTAPKNRAGSSLDTLTSTTNLGFTRAFAGGGQLLVDFANSLVFTAGPTGQTSWTSNLLVTATQPLLRGGGRAFRLESLTQAERDTLYAVRNFARFRKQFWAGVTTSNGGYLDLLIALQTIRNQQANLRSSEQTYQLYQEQIKGGKISPVDLEQYYQQFVESRFAVQQAEVNLQNLLDSYKLTLGIPVRVPVKLDDKLLDPFVLNDPDLEKLRDDEEKYLKDRTAALDAEPTAAELDRNAAQLRTFADRLSTLTGKVEKELSEWGKRVESATDTSDRVMGVYADMQDALPEATAELKKLVAALAAPLPAKPAAAVAEIFARTRRLIQVTDAVLSVQTEIRVYRIDLPPLNWEEDAALAYARDNRLDLQTQLAVVTDNWRRVRVTANQLLPGLTVNGSANIGTDPDRDNPLGFAAEASRYTVGVQFDGPLNRRAERNAYRAALISYHRSRREYMALSDGIDRSIRQDLRALKLARQSFETARATLLSNARTLESQRLSIIRPDAQAGANSTATLNLLRAQDRLLTARNALIASYFGYEQLRIQLLLDLEALTLDPEGRPANDRSLAPAAPAATPDRPGSEPLPAPKPVPEPAEGKGAGK